MDTVKSVQQPTSPGGTANMKCSCGSSTSTNSSNDASDKEEDDSHLSSVLTKYKDKREESGSDKLFISKNKGGVHRADAEGEQQNHHYCHNRRKSKETGEDDVTKTKTMVKEDDGSALGDANGRNTTEEDEEDEEQEAGGTSNTKFKNFTPPANWVDAPEFVPRWMVSSAEPEIPTKLNPSATGVNESCGTFVGRFTVDPSHQALEIDTTTELCPYAMVGECRYGYKCLLVHGLKCEYCGNSCLHPSDETQRQRHLKECVEQHERDMELSFAVARSIDKVCGVCYEKVMSKYPAGEQRFGILPSCNHIFCLSCIRRWRQERQFDNKTIRACPECRVTSDFVCPSRYWVDNKEEKDKLIGSYKVALSKKPCRYYRNGEGQCPFGNKCFYLHALPDGTAVDVGPPRRISGAQGRTRTTNQTLSVWEYIEEWEMQWWDLEDFMGMFDSDTASEFSFPDMDVVDLEGDDELYVDWDRS